MGEDTGGGEHCIVPLTLALSYQGREDKRVIFNAFQYSNDYTFLSFGRPCLPIGRDIEFV